ncbi:hypothetical protein [Microbacterium lacticum]
METAIDIVRRAAEGAIDHDELVRILKTWHYELQCKTTGLAGDWQTVPNSFNAVGFAYKSLELLTDEDYAEIVATPLLRARTAPL